jgi:hypothetical protein
MNSTDVRCFTSTSEIDQDSVDLGYVGTDWLDNKRFAVRRRLTLGLAPKPRAVQSEEQCGKLSHGDEPVMP